MKFLCPACLQEAFPSISGKSAWCPRCGPCTSIPEAGEKCDAGKPRWDLIPPAALEDVARVLEFGARKYAPDNWRKVDGWRWRYARAGLGHLFAFVRGEKLDPESKLPHLAHAACCVLFLLELDR